ncbi:MAG: hypothetical protein K5892_07290 [Acholeplasmatales bacterium]|nr:hypothetical protein [Acholeplasmatales bacterium]
MKLKNIIISSLVLFSGSFMLLSCNGKNNKKESSSEKIISSSEEIKSSSEIISSSSEIESSSEVISSEVVMNNFLYNLDALKYTIDTPNYRTVNVSSNNLISFNYTDGQHLDYSYMTIKNENSTGKKIDETFKATFDGETINKIEYMGSDKSIDYVYSSLPNYWTSYEASEGNIWNLFYNNVDNPLEFMSKDSTVINTCKNFAGIGDMFASRIDHIVLTASTISANNVTITVKFDDGYPILNDIDFTISFGNSKGDDRAKAWMENENRQYPEILTQYDDVYEFILDSVFLPGYGTTAVPFPDYASYALTINGDNYASTDEVVIRDSHATEENKDNYIKKLKDLGFTETKEELSGGTYLTKYRILLREKYKCYSDVLVEYSETYGVSIFASKYYDEETYNDLDGINDAINSLGFIKLNKTDNFTEFYATDEKNHRTEDLLYFFDYNMALNVQIRYSDLEKVNTYMETYINNLLDNNYVKKVQEDEIYYEYSNSNIKRSVRYTIEGDLVLMFYKSEQFINNQTAYNELIANGFETTTADKIDKCRDLYTYLNVKFDYDDTLAYSLQYVFDTEEEVTTFLDNVTANAIQNGFVTINEYEGEYKRADLLKTNTYIYDDGTTIKIFSFEYTDGSLQTGFDYRVYQK